MAKLVLVGPEGTKTYELEDHITTLGRSPANHIQLEDKASSRKHCMIKKEADTYTLVDMGSANGTFVNGERVKEHILRPEDRVKIGKTFLIFKAR
jgi:pSer/pThr/pTyr-binding forkhead associated (FHA) protein